MNAWALNRDQTVYIIYYTCILKFIYICMSGWDRKFHTCVYNNIINMYLVVLYQFNLGINKAPY